MDKIISIILLLSLAGCSGDELTSNMAFAIQETFIECLEKASSDDQKDICHAQNAIYLKTCFNRDGHTFSFTCPNHCTDLLTPTMRNK